ncbi:MAG: hypothetical protein J0H15_07380 [Xanthomonadales bacterium]|nr:hypothetical protein [Xanthomonadales bacterium]
MARGRRSGWALPLAGVAAAVALIGGYVYQQRGSVPPTPAAPPATQAPPPAAGAQSGAVTLSGRLHAAAPVRDPQLGIEADAIALYRMVEVRQWQETCSAAGCEHALVWSEKWIDPARFREPAGHQNPRPPFASQRFLARDIRLGERRVDPLLALEGAAAEPLQVRAAQLPPNLAATFREHDGFLYAGADPARPAAGDLRVAYRVVPAGERSLTGILVGDRLQAPRR